MDGYAYVFHHPQYGGLRVVEYDHGVFFFSLDDLVAITDVGRDQLFLALANTEGKVIEVHVEESMKKLPKKFEQRIFFAEEFGDGEKVEISHRKATRDMIFVDPQVVRDMTVGCSNDPERKLFYKWVKDFIQPVMEDDDLEWHYTCVLVEKVLYDPLTKPTDIRYAADGLYINDMRIN